MNQYADIHDAINRDHNLMYIPEFRRAHDLYQTRYDSFFIAKSDLVYAVEFARTNAHLIERFKTRAESYRATNNRHTLAILYAYRTIAMRMFWTDHQHPRSIPMTTLASSNPMIAKDIK